MLRSVRWKPLRVPKATRGPHDGCLLGGIAEAPMRALVTRSARLAPSDYFAGTRVNCVPDISERAILIHAARRTPTRSRETT